MKKKLYRSTSDRMIAGVMGGLGEYFNQDATLFRIGFLLLLLVTGVFPGVIFYAIGALLIPEGVNVTPSEPVAPVNDAGTV